MILNFPVASGTEIAAGDAVWQNGNLVQPAADFPFTTDAPTTRAAFTEDFVGIAQAASANGETDPVPVETSPLIKHNVTFSNGQTTLGHPVSLAFTGLSFENQTWAAITDAALCVGRLASQAAGSPPTGDILIASARVPSTSNVNAQLGTTPP